MQRGVISQAVLGQRKEDKSRDIESSFIKAGEVTGGHCIKDAVEMQMISTEKKEVICTDGLSRMGGERFWLGSLSSFHMHLFKPWEK